MSRDGYLKNASLFDIAQIQLLLTRKLTFTRYLTVKDLSGSAECEFIEPGLTGCKGDPEH